MRSKRLVPFEIFVVPLNLLLCHVRSHRPVSLCCTWRKKTRCSLAGAAGSRFPERLVRLLGSVLFACSGRQSMETHDSLLTVRVSPLFPMKGVTFSQRPKLPAPLPGFIVNKKRRKRKPSPLSFEGYEKGANSSLVIVVVAVVVTQLCHVER